ncbi:MAG: adenylate/guanylate cyclase domain-containing protein [Acidimicrobiia bacterium]|nr:adenylate/guanylate cyclase domain-containing protein [Acidimicrobiia bacterium]
MCHSVDVTKSKNRKDIATASDSQPKTEPRPKPPVELLQPLIAKDTGPAKDWAEAAQADQIAPPHELSEEETHLKVKRTFCFADLSKFTAFTRNNGPHAAVAQLGEFRRITRNVAAKRGVRVAKWLGDGVMLVGTEASPTIALGAHLVYAFSDSEIQVRVGIAGGIALLFEGDDYIGEPVNLAAKLCAAAEPDQILAVAELADLPSWVSSEDNVTVRIKDVGAIGGVRRLKVKPRTAQKS